MKKTKKRPRIVVAVLAILLVIGGLILLRNYLLSAYIGADTLSIPNTISQRTIENGKLQTDTLTSLTANSTDVRLSKPAVLPSCPQRLIDLAYPATSPVAGQSPAPAPACLTSTDTNKVTVLPKILAHSGETNSTSYFRATSTTAPAAIAFGTGIGMNANNTLVENVIPHPKGLIVSTGPKWGYLQVGFGKMTAGSSIKGTIQFGGSFLSAQSIMKDSKFPLEANDAVSVDPSTNTVYFTLTSNDLNDYDTFYIQYCCGASVPRVGYDSGTMQLPSPYTFDTFWPSFSAGWAPNKACTKTDISLAKSVDGTIFEQASILENVLSRPFKDKTAAERALKYTVIVKSCNQLDSPRLKGNILTGAISGLTPTPVPSKTPSPTATCTAAGGVCTTDYTPVCGKDGKTYSNACEAAKKCVVVASQGVCPSTTPTATASAKVTATASAKVTATASAKASPTAVATLTYPPVPNTTSTATETQVPNPPIPIEPTESLAPGQSPQPSVVPTVVIIDRIFNPQGSAGQFLASGIKSGPSFWIFILIVAGIGGYIVYRIAISKE